MPSKNKNVIDLQNLLDDKYPEWKQWYRWHNAHLTIRQQLMIEICLHHERPYKDLAAILRVASISNITRNLKEFMHQLQEDDLQDNYKDFVMKFIDGVYINRSEYEQFNAWKQMT